MSAADIPNGCPPFLRYVTDKDPGYRRKARAEKIYYVDEKGRRVRSFAVIKRIQALVIPPAYTDVWICRDPQGHLQATGRDARGRKQYRYHPLWRQVRDAAKYDRLLSFGNLLSSLRRALDQRIRARPLSKEKVVAAAILILDETSVRIGNSQYVRQNKSYGLTTLRGRHLRLSGGKINFQFRGKSGVPQQVSLDHPRLARILRRCKELPGQALFQYLDEEDNPCSVSSADINQCLHQLTGADFTAKDYRTWAASVHALAYLRECLAQGQAATKNLVSDMCKHVAAHLGNTPAICRKCYIHPAIIESFMDGRLNEVGWSAGRARRRWLKPEEVDLLVFLGTCSDTP